MPNYGYRLFTVQIANSNKRKTVNFKDCGGEHYAEVATRLLKSLSVKTMVGDAPLGASEAVDIVLDDIEAESRGYIDQPAFRVEDVRTVDRTVRTTMWTGRFGSHDKALSASGAHEDADIRDKAASKQFRAVLALPEDGMTGILAMEDISRSCPVAPLTRWLRWSSQEESISVSDGENRPWWRPVVHPLADERHLIEMITMGQVDKLELVKQSITPARTRQKEKFRITAPLVDKGVVSQVAQVVRGWLRHPESNRADEIDEVITDAQAAKQLASIIGPEIEDLDLDDGWVVLRDADDQKKRISPTRMSEIFTYPQSKNGRIDTPKFYARIRETAQRLQAAQNLMFDWPAQ